MVYRYGKAVKTVKAPALSWDDTSAYDANSGMYWIYGYYVRAYKVVNGKRVYSKSTKTVTI